MKILAFDPDLHHCGWAYLDSGNVDPLQLGTCNVPSKLKGLEATLCMIDFVQGREWGKPDLVIIEGQQFYRPGKAKGDPINHHGLRGLGCRLPGHGVL